MPRRRGRGSSVIPPPLRARVDMEGALVSADAILLQLQQEAGADLGQNLAVPQLAHLIALSFQAQRSVHRHVIFGGDSQMIHADVDVTPDDGGANILIRNWQARPAPLPLAVSASPVLSPPYGWSWECNAELRLIALRAAPEAPPVPLAWEGRLMMDVLELHSDATGQFPLLQARASQQGFDVQNISVTTPVRVDMRLSGAPLYDALGYFCGYRGIAEPVQPDDNAQCPFFVEEDAPRVDLRFNRRVDDALRGPINRIIAAAESISGQFEGPVRADYARYAGDIAHAGRHLLGLVDDLADVQTIERPDFKVSADAIDLGDLARRAAGLLALKAEEKSIQIHSPPPDDGMPATGEFRRALQVLLNLVGNAVRYSPEGTHIWLRLERRRDCAAIIVTDQGRGISAQQQQVIFEKFERLGRRDGGGSGLGLYIARKLARAMGGDLTVESEPEQGASFILELPFRD